MKRKRILYIHHGSTHGGAPISLLSLLNYLDHSSYEPIVCSSENDNEVLELFARNGYQTCACRLQRFAHTTGGSYNLLKLSGWQQLFGWFRDYRAAMQHLEVFLRDLQPDIVHFNSLTLAPYAQVPARMGIPNVVHVRESVVHGVFGLRRAWLKRQLKRYARRVIAICRDNLDRLQTEAGFCQVIYNPIDFRKFDSKIDKQRARAALGIAPDAKVALFAGGSVPEAKGLREYLEAMGRVKKREPRAVCLMPSFSLPPSPHDRTWTIKRRIGWLMGIYRKQDRQFKQIEKSGLSDSIVHSEFTYEIERWIAASDVVCAPHVLPHFSRTVIEAGAMKKPVVAFRVGGIEEVVTNRGNGLLIQVGDVTGLAEAIEELFSNENECRTMGENGWQQALRLFDAGRSAAQVARLYEELSPATGK